MQRVVYSRKKLIIGAVFFFMMIFFSLFTIIFPLIFFISMIMNIAKACGKLNALTWDSRSITVHGYFTKKTLDWSIVEEVKLENRWVFHSIIPIGRFGSILFRTSQAKWGTKETRLQILNLKLTRAQIPALIEKLNGEISASALGAAKIPPISAPNASQQAIHKSLPSANGFDSEAATARYTAHKNGGVMGPTPTLIQQPATSTNARELSKPDRRSPEYQAAPQGQRAASFGRKQS